MEVDSGRHPSFCFSESRALKYDAPTRRLPWLIVSWCDDLYSLVFVVLPAIVLTPGKHLAAIAAGDLCGPPRS